MRRGYCAAGDWTASMHLCTPAPPPPPPPFPSTQKAKKVYLLLKKESDAEWRFLKG